MVQTAQINPSHEYILEYGIDEVIKNIEDITTAINNSNKIKNIIIIIQRLSHSHHYYMRNPYAVITADGIYLRKDLGRIQIPYNAVESGSAETAAHTAADLR